MLMSVATAFLLATLVCKYAQAQSSTSVRSLPITIKNACSVIGCAREAARVRQAGECSVTPGKKQRSGVGRKRNPATRIEMSRREGMVSPLSSCRLTDQREGCTATILVGYLKTY